MNAKGWLKRSQKYWNEYYAGIGIESPEVQKKKLLKAKTAELNYYLRFNEEMKEFE